MVNKVDTLPTWPQHSDSKEEFLDMESYSQMTVRTKLRKTHCEFLKDPEGFLEQVTSGSTRNFLTTPAWFIMAAISVIFFLIK